MIPEWVFCLVERLARRAYEVARLKAETKRRLRAARGAAAGRAYADVSRNVGAQTRAAKERERK